MKESQLHLRDAAYKDADPLKTVARIRRILAENGIEVEEHPNESSVVHCHSLRLTVKGISFGVNGKGLTEEFALASAYGELMERLQLGMIGSSNAQKLDAGNESGAALSVPAEQLLQECPRFYQAVENPPSGKATLDGRAILMQYADADGNVKAFPFYSLSLAKRVHLPQALENVVYGSNGAAAGNSMEEAVVQAISEIEERHQQIKILTEGIGTPCIPEEVLQGFPVAYDIIQSLRQNGFRVFVKDCSLGKRFPTVCVCCIEEKSGRYHTHFGAYPVLEIAIERALTETFQGRSLQKFAFLEDFLYEGSSFAFKNRYGEFVQGVSEKSPDFFLAESKHPFNRDLGFSGKNSRELLAELIEYFRKDGYDILVRDASCLGFPTYRVIIPGYSEIQLRSAVLEQDPYRYYKLASRALRTPRTAELEDHIGLFLHIGEMKHLSALTGRKNLTSFSACTKLPLRISGAEDGYLFAAALGYVYYAVGNHKLLPETVDKMLPLAREEDLEYLICLKRYFSAMQNGCSAEKTRAILDAFHKADTVRALYACIEGGENPFAPFVLHCTEDGCATCPLRTKCDERATIALFRLLYDRTTAIDPCTLEKQLAPFAQS